MPDYSACSNFYCSRSPVCARYLMVYGERQSISKFKAATCNLFWPVELAPFKLLTQEQADIRHSQRESDEPTTESQ